jgi:acyl dehydratase
MTQFNLAHLHGWVDGPPLDVTSAAIAAYARATNDSSAAALEGSVAPPVFAVVPIWEGMMAATLPVVPEEVRSLVVHGEQDLWLHEPLRPGARVRVRSSTVGVHVKSSGTTVVCKSETSDEDGKLLNEQYSTTFYRGVSGGQGAGDAAPGHAFPELDGRAPDAEITYPIDEDQTIRYADASGDHFAIHLDEEAAKAVGLPGRIVHGLCVMAFAGRAALEYAGRDVDAMRRLAVRFSRPVFPGTRVTTRLWELGEGELVFDAVAEDGSVVLRDGVALIAPR